MTFEISTTEDIITSMTTLQNVTPMTNQLTPTQFVPMYCMILEEFCLTHKLNIMEIIGTINQLITEVNTTEGRYKTELEN